MPVQNEFTDEQIADVKVLESTLSHLAAVRTAVKTIADKRDPILGPDLTLARRHVEDAYTRIENAIKDFKGIDPYPHLIQENE